jgi:arginine decarboxylase
VDSVSPRGTTPLHPPAHAYNSWSQFRADAWSRLEEASGRLLTALARGLPTDGLIEAASELLDGLAPVEQYWAFRAPTGSSA